MCGQTFFFCCNSIKCPSTFDDWETNEGGKERAEVGRVVSVCYLQRSDFLLLLLISGWWVDLGQTHYGLVAEAQPHHFFVLPSVSVGWEGSLLV